MKRSVGYIQYHTQLWRQHWRLDTKAYYKWRDAWHEQHNHHRKAYMRTWAGFTAVSIAYGVYHGSQRTSLLYT